MCSSTRPRKAVNKKGRNKKRVLCTYILRKIEGRKKYFIFQNQK